MSLGNNDNNEQICRTTIKKKLNTLSIFTNTLTFITYNDKYESQKKKDNKYFPIQNTLKYILLIV